MKKIISGIEVEIYRRKVKNVRIKVSREGVVSLIIPIRLSEQSGIAFFISKLDWIKKCLNKSQKSGEKFTFTSGEIFSLFGEKTTLVVTQSDKNGFSVENGKLMLSVKNLDINEVKKQFFESLKVTLAEKSKKYFEKWERLTGLKSKEIKIRKTVSRWGSCNTQTRVINLSIYLANLPEFCLDYVVLHELCHLRYANHGERFKAMLTKYMPKWKAIRKYMRENGNNLRVLA